MTPTWRDGADHHWFLTAGHEAEAQDRVPSHLHQARGGWEPVQVNLLQGAALGHLAGKHRGGGTVSKTQNIYSVSEITGARTSYR